MNILKVLSVPEGQVHVIELCKRCAGTGFCWSTLEFGDVPGDEEEIPCHHCNSTGRTIKLTLHVSAIVPSDFDTEGE